MIKNQRPGSDLLDGLRGWDRGQNSALSEKGNVAYQIKGNYACINKLANILSSAPQPDPLGGVKRSKFNFFQNMVMLHIILNGIMDAATW